MTAGSALTLKAAHSHLYPGAGGALAGVWRQGPCLLTFADGVAASAILSEGGRLDVAPHRTAAGTAIGAKSWRIRREGNRFRVLERA